MGTNPEDPLAFNYPPGQEWTDDGQRNLDDQAKAARRGNTALPPDTTEESQEPPDGHQQ